MTPFSLWERLSVALDESRDSVDEAFMRLSASVLTQDDDM